MQDFSKIIFLKKAVYRMEVFEKQPKKAEKISDYLLDFLLLKLFSGAQR